MMDLMYDANGIGLAAPQVGISKRFFVMHIDSDNEEPYVFINPVIKEFSKEESEYEEGCLSFPKQNVLIHRPASIVLEYLNINGKKIIEKFSDLHATCIQHEIDHLNGITITDHIESPDEKLAAKKLAEQIKNEIK